VETDRARSLARRWGWTTVAVTAVVVYGGCALLRYDLGSTTVSFVVFGGLFGGTAWFVGHEVGTYRAAGPPRDRFVCTEGHVSYDAGLCACGRRSAPYVPPDIWPRIRRMVWFGVALLVVLVATGLLLGA
jgi:hypothetical protein